MSVISRLRRFRVPVFLFSLCLIGILIVHDQAASMQLVAAQNLTPTQLPVTGTNKSPLSVSDNVRKTVLENGLTVLTKEVRTAPVVSVQVWYKVGSRNEAPGVNGIAHQLEHMMFKGTKNRPIQFGRLFSALGSDSNAFTSFDQTAYYGTVERQKLPALLELEADRMQSSLILPEQLATEKQVVISELQGYENSPEYRLNRAVMRAAFPEHPYGLPVGGTKADVQKFTVEQVRNYYRRFYSPSNATLIVVGDIDTEATLKSIKQTFGKVANSPTAKVKTPELKTTLKSQSTSPKTPIILREQGAGALLNAVYPLPNINHPDMPALDVMDSILTEGRSSRLYQVLIESGLASDVSGAAAGLVAGGWYEFNVTAVPGQQLAKIDSVLLDAIATLTSQGVTPEEVNRAKAQVQASVILNNRDISSQAMQLGYDQTTGGDYRFTDRYLQALQKVIPADVQRVATQYLKPEVRTVGFFEPTQLDGTSGGSAGSDGKTSENFSPGAPVDPAEVAKYLPAVVVNKTPLTRTLPQSVQMANGLELLLLPDSSTPTVTLSGYMKAGKEFDPETKEGLAELTADNLMSGTKTKDALTLAKALEDKGASLGFVAHREGVDIGGYSLAPDLSILIQTFADVVKNATFPADEVELSRKRALAALKQDLDNPATVAQRTFQQTVYPQNHPFHRFPTIESLQRITREDISGFKATHYRPDTTILVLVGEFDPEKVRSLVQNALGDWKATGSPPTVEYPDVLMPQKLVNVNPELPGKTQAITTMGYKGINRQDPRYYAAMVLNQIVGGDTLSSRLGTEVRDRQGLTYGIYSYFQAGKTAGPFLISMQTAPEDASRAIASTRKLLQQVQQQGVSVGEVESAKRTLVSGYTVSLANPDELTSTILRNQVYGLGAEELRNFTQKIQAVTLEQVNKAAQELLHPDNLVVVTAGPGTVAEQKPNQLGTKN